MCWPGQGLLEPQVWHMPHGITLLTTPKNSINSISSLLVSTFMQHLASYPISAPLLTTSSPLPSPLTVTSHQDQKGLMPLLALLLVSICDAFLTTYTLSPSHLSEDSHHEYLKLSHTHQIILNSEDFLLQKWIRYEYH